MNQTLIIFKIVSLVFSTLIPASIPLVKTPLKFPLILYEVVLLMFFMYSALTLKFSVKETRRSLIKEHLVYMEYAHLHIPVFHKKLLFIKKYWKWLHNLVQTNDYYYWMGIVTLNHIIVYKLLVINTNTWNHDFYFRIFVIILCCIAMTNYTNTYAYAYRIITMTQ